MPLLALDLFARIVAIRINAGSLFSALFTLWLSVIAAVGLASRSADSGMAPPMRTARPIATDMRRAITAAIFRQPHNGNGVVTIAICIRRGIEPNKSRRLLWA